MVKITVVGSGASGVHFALSALKKGHQVEMLDVGYSAPPNVNPEFSFVDIKSKLEDPVAYFLGKNYETVVSPDFDKEIYEFPPNKMYIFKVPRGFKSDSRNFDPLFSFARGGLAEAWTGGSYPFNDQDLALFPFGYETLKPYYEEIAERIGLIGDRDDISRFFPWHENLLPPLELDENSKIILEKYQKRRKLLNRKGFSHIQWRLIAQSAVRRYTMCREGAGIDNIVSGGVTQFSAQHYILIMKQSDCLSPVGAW